MTTQHTRSARVVVAIAVTLAIALPASGAAAAGTGARAVTSTPAPGVAHQVPAVAVPALPAAALLAPKAVTSPPTAPSITLPVVLRGHVITVLPTTRKVVALTFDGGGDAAGVASILRTLSRFHVPASFFLTGRFSRLFPHVAKALAATGDPVGNHTDTHKSAPTLSPAALRAQVVVAAASIRAATGLDARPWFRFPYGASTAADVRQVNGLGYACIGWTVDTAGWMGTSQASVASIKARVLKRLKPGEIILMHLGENPHDRSTLDADALPGLISLLQARGYSFVALTSMLPVH